MIDLVEQRIQSGVVKPGAPLPGRVALAREAQVSTATVSAAIALLKRSGVLTGVRGQRPRVALTGEPAPAPILQGSQPFDTIAAHLKDDIVTGRYSPGKFIPAGKELCTRFHASKQTVRKAVDAVCREGLLIRQGRRCAVPPISLPSTNAHVVFIWYNIRPLLPTHEMDTSFIGALERECFRNSVRLEKLIASVRGGKVVLYHHEDSRPAGEHLIQTSMGVVYLVNWYESVNDTVLRWLSRLSKPLSIVDWLGDWKMPPGLAQRGKTQWLTSSVTAQPGLDAGRFLIGEGHRGVGFFSPFSLPWPAQRFQGIREACALSREACTSEFFLQRKVPSESKVQETMNVLNERILQNLRNGPQLSADYVAGSSLLERTAWLVHENNIYFSLLLPLFEQALCRKDLTAWVGCNDFVAMMAWSFLKSRKVRVPEDISLMGFGNTPETVKTDLTSYDFDFEHTVAAALSFLLRPSQARWQRKLARPRISGFVIQRGSTGRV